MSVKDLEVNRLIKRFLWQSTTLAFLIAMSCFSIAVQAEEVQYESKQESVLFKKEKRPSKEQLINKAISNKRLHPLVHIR